MFTFYITTCVLFHQSLALILSYHEYSPLDITYYMSTCFCMLVLTTRFSMHVYDSDLSIHVCLSLQATWHYHHHSPGSSDSPGSSCPGHGAWSGWFFQLLIRVVQLKRGSPANHPEPYPSRPLVRLPSFLM